MNKREKMDKIFMDFEGKHFTNEGDYCRTTNLVFEFADWIDSDAGTEAIAEAFDLWEEEDAQKIEDIRAEFSRGIDKFLEK